MSWVVTKLSQGTCWILWSKGNPLTQWFCFPFSQKQPSLTPMNTQRIECPWLGVSDRHGALTCWSSLNLIVWKCSQNWAEFSTLEKMLLRVVNGQWLENHKSRSYLNKENRYTFGIWAHHYNGLRKGKGQETLMYYCAEISDNLPTGQNVST